MLKTIEQKWISAQDHLAPIAVTFLPVAYFAQAVQHRLDDYPAEAGWAIALIAGYAMEAGGMKAFKSWARGEGVGMVVFYVILAIAAVVGLEQSTEVIDLLIGFVAYGLPFLVYSTAAKTIVKAETKDDKASEKRVNFDLMQEQEDRKVERRIKMAQAKAEIEKGKESKKVSETFATPETLPKNLRQLRKMPEHVEAVAKMTVNEVVSAYSVGPKTANVWIEYSKGETE